MPQNVPEGWGIPMWGRQLLVGHAFLNIAHVYILVQWGEAATLQ